MGSRVWGLFHRPPPILTCQPLWGRSKMNFLAATEPADRSPTLPWASSFWPALPPSRTLQHVAQPLAPIRTRGRLAEHFFAGRFDKTFWCPGYLYRFFHEFCTLAPLSVPKTQNPETGSSLFVPPARAAVLMGDTFFDQISLKFTKKLPTITEGYEKSSAGDDLS